MLFFFFTKHRTLKWIFFACAISVAIAVVIQHVHYSYDVIAAPIFAYIAYRVITKFSKHYQNDTPVV